MRSPYYLLTAPELIEQSSAPTASGGVTPPLQEVLDILPLLQKPVHIMVRPRGGNFVYSDAEFEQMKYDIRIIKAAPAPG
jgi:copper homeostasis protein